MDVILTVAESKRLIAKGVAQHPLVKQAMAKGYVVVCKGTTNSYIAEELLGRAIKKTEYVTGHTLPARGKAELSANLPDVIFKDGKQLEGSTQAEVVARLGPGDVFIKGANALNYQAQQAALLIGSPIGGTMGGAIGVLTARSVHLLIPVGLEKSIPGDFTEIAEYVAEARRSGAQGPAFWPIHGEIFTELEAVEVLTGAQAVAIGAGGIAGAEGAIRLLVTGTTEQMEATTSVMAKIHGERKFVE